MLVLLVLLALLALLALLVLVAGSGAGGVGGRTTTGAITLGGGEFDSVGLGLRLMVRRMLW